MNNAIKNLKLANGNHQTRRYRVSVLTVCHNVECVSVGRERSLPLLVALANAASPPLPELAQEREP
jgi:hypothetical protein